MRHESNKKKAARDGWGFPRVLAERDADAGKLAALAGQVNCGNSRKKLPGRPKGRDFSGMTAERADELFAVFPGRKKRDG